MLRGTIRDHVTHSAAVRAVLRLREDLSHDARADCFMR
jgi:hypothetical protein